MSMKIEGKEKKGTRYINVKWNSVEKRKSNNKKKMIFNKPLKDFIHENQMKTHRKELE